MCGHNGERYEIAKRTGMDRFAYRITRNSSGAICGRGQRVISKGRHAV
jgi:hypothetical protein